MCKELCGQVYDDFKAGKIGYQQFKAYHTERVIEVMRADAAAGKPFIAFLDYKDGSAEIVTGGQPQTHGAEEEE